MLHLQDVQEKKVLLRVAALGEAKIYGLSAAHDRLDRRVPIFHLRCWLSYEKFLQRVSERIALHSD